MSDAAIIAIAAGFAQVIGLFALWIKLHYGVEQAMETKRKAETIDRKLDENTTITRAGTAAAATTALAAASSAEDARVATKTMQESLNQKLNGGIDAAINAAVAPMREALEQNQANIKDVTGRFDDLTRYVHQRNHDVLDAMGVLSNRIELVVQMIQQQQQQGGSK